MNDELRKTLGVLGAFCLIGAVVGGGLKMAGSELPVIGSLPRQVLLAALGAVFPTLASWRPPGDVPFLVTQKMASISSAVGSIYDARPQVHTVGGGTKVRRIVAAGYERSADGKTYRFFDRRHRIVQELPSYKVDTIRRAGLDE
jgi:hypothetical protein